jgi:hypothetical protein
MSMKNLSLLLLSFLISFSSINGQTSLISNNIWISGGFGFFSAKNVDYDTYGALSLNCSANLVRNKITDTIDKPYKWNNKWEIRFISHVENIPDDVTISHYDLGFLYGKSCSFAKIMQLNFSAGIGVLKREIVEYSDPGPNPVFGPIPEIKKYYTPNIPLEVELYVVPARNFGIGIAGFANFNTERNINGLLLKVEFGRIR